MIIIINNNNENVNNQNIKRLWMDFGANSRIGKKIRTLKAGWAQRNNIGHHLVPISRKSSTIYHNNNRTINVKRNHFPVVPACATTIHASQGGTYDKIVYCYEKKHSQQLVYVALSRVTSLEGLFIISPVDDHVFYHGRKDATSMDSLTHEFARLATNPLRVTQDEITDFVRLNNEASFLSFNCQSLRSHYVDLNDTVTQGCTMLLLSETWLRNDERVDVPNFECCVQFKRNGQRAGGVAIYKKMNDTRAVTPHIDVIGRQTAGMSVTTQPIGDLCTAEFHLLNGKKVLSVVVYISPNKAVDDIINFLHFVLAPYSEKISTILHGDYHLLPMIMSGNFNVNFATPEAQSAVCR